MVFLSHICGREVIKIFFITHGWCKTVISGLFNDLTIFFWFVEIICFVLQMYRVRGRQACKRSLYKSMPAETCSIFGWTFFTPQTRITNSLFKKMGNSTFCKATLREEERWFFCMCHFVTRQHSFFNILFQSFTHKYWKIRWQKFWLRLSRLSQKWSAIILWNSMLELLFMPRNQLKWITTNHAAQHTQITCEFWMVCLYYRYL